MALAVSIGMGLKVSRSKKTLKIETVGSDDKQMWVD